RRARDPVHRRGVPPQRHVNGATTPPRVAGYALAKLLERVREDEVLQEQSDRIAAYAKERGWELVNVYTDSPGRGSVGHGKRIGLAELEDDLDDLEKVVVVSLDRLRPNVEVMVELVERFAEHGVDLVSLDEKFDTGEATGES